MSDQPNRPFDDDTDPFDDDEFGDWDENEALETDALETEEPLPYAAHDEPRDENGQTLADDVGGFEDERAGEDALLPVNLELSDPFDDDDPFEIPTEIAPSGHVRCSGCGTTWDRIRHDGRVGCAACYAEFRQQLSGVMERVQRGETHTGKTPRTIEKRQHRLEHLRRRRDNQLAVLQGRLDRAVAAEKYEEAARLRDKIKVVTSTIVG